MGKQVFCVTLFFIFAGTLISYTKGLFAWAPFRARPPISLSAAVANHDVRSIQNHIAMGSDINMIDGMDNTPLMMAVLLQHFEIVRLLEKAGANLIIKNKRGDDALLIAARLGNEKIFRWLMEKISSTHPEKKADGSLEQARQVFIHTQVQPFLSDALNGIAMFGGLMTVGAMAGLIWYQKHKLAYKEHIA